MPGAGDEEDPVLNEEHWAYMDRYSDRMVARGPTLSADRSAWTGSVHILDLPSAEAARQFAEREPFNQAGRFERHFIRRFENLLGRTMWERSADPDVPCFLVIAQAAAEPGERRFVRPFRHIEALPHHGLIVLGDLSAPDEANNSGVALVLQAPTRQALDLILSDDNARLDGRLRVEVHDWEFGGRR